MKKLLLLCGAIFPVLLGAQSFTFYSKTAAAPANGATFNYWLPQSSINSVILHDLVFQNTSQQTKSIRVIRHQQLAGASYSYFNDCNICYTPSIDTGHVVLLAAGDSCYIGSHFVWDGTFATSAIHYTVLDTGNISDSVSTTLVYFPTNGNVGIPGLAGRSNLFAPITPNPVTDQFQFDYPPASKATLIILDAGGRRISETSLDENGGHAAITVSELPQGFYFAAFSGDCIVPVIRKFVISR